MSIASLADIEALENEGCIEKIGKVTNLGIGSKVVGFCLINETACKEKKMKIILGTFLTLLTLETKILGCRFYSVEAEKQEILKYLFV